MGQNTYNYHDETIRWAGSKVFYSTVIPKTIYSNLIIFYKCTVFIFIIFGNTYSKITLDRQSGWPVMAPTV